MSYAEHRRIIDADSHVIELDDFLDLDAAEPKFRDKIPTIFEQKNLPVEPENLANGRELFARRQSSQETMAECEAALLDNTKRGWTRLGAFDPAERSHTLDLLGFEMQLVLPTLAFHQVAHVKDDDVLATGSVILNKAMGDFCRHDPRLKAMGYLPLSLGPERAKEIMDQGFADGCYSYIVETNEPNDDRPSFTHQAFDPVWAGFADSQIPFAVHVAANGDYMPVSPSFKNNGKDELELGGDAPAGELGIMTISNSAQLFLAALIFDGVFDRHPGLRAISMEHAASWLPSWLHFLEFTTKMFKRKRPFVEEPTATARSRIKVSPFAGEPVGWIIEQVGPEMLVFASDYPHPEGSADPIGIFEATMQNCDQATMDAFFHGNMADAMGIAV